MSDASAKPSKLAVFGARLKSTLGLWIIVILVFISGQPWAFTGLVWLLTLGGVIEFSRLFAGLPPRGSLRIPLAIGLAVVLTLGILLTTNPGKTSPTFALEMAGMIIATLGAFCWRFRHPITGHQSVDAVSHGLLAYLYVPILFGCFVLRLSYLPVGETAVPGAWLLLFMIASAKFTDMGAYATGSLIGKTKMAPHISPAKTWEGFAGALLFAQAGAWAVWFASNGALDWLPPIHVAILGLLLALSAVAGDLAESILKRSLEVKDSGNSLPGIGGILDLIDSLCFAAPVLYFYLLAFGLV